MNSSQHPIVSQSMCAAVDECDRPKRTKGYCAKLYARWRVNGTTDIVRKARLECSVEGCDKPHTCNGYCHLHLWRVQTYGSTELPERTQVYEQICTVEGCSAKQLARGYVSSPLR